MEPNGAVDPAGPSGTAVEVAVAELADCCIAQVCED
jgi:hypothetical protein